MGRFGGHMYKLNFLVDTQKSKKKQDKLTLAFQHAINIKLHTELSKPSTFDT